MQTTKSANICTIVQMAKYGKMQWNEQIGKSVEKHKYGRWPK